MLTKRVLFLIVSLCVSYYFGPFTAFGGLDSDICSVLSYQCAETFTMPGLRMNMTDVEIQAQENRIARTSTMIPTEMGRLIAKFKDKTQDCIINARYNRYILTVTDPQLAEHARLMNYLKNKDGTKPSRPWGSDLGFADFSPDTAFTGSEFSHYDVSMRAIRGKKANRTVADILADALKNAAPSPTTDGDIQLVPIGAKDRLKVDSRVVDALADCAQADPIEVASIVQDSRVVKRMLGDLEMLARWTGMLANSSYGRLVYQLADCMQKRTLGLGCLYCEYCDVTISAIRWGASKYAGSSDLNAVFTFQVLKQNNLEHRAEKLKRGTLLKPRNMEDAMEDLKPLEPAELLNNVE